MIYPYVVHVFTQFEGATGPDIGQYPALLVNSKGLTNGAGV
jgi:hypothetical protein